MTAVMATPQAGGDRASVALAFKRGFGALGRRWLGVLGLTAALMIAPYVAVTLAYRALPPGQAHDLRFQLLVVAGLMLCGALVNQAVARRLLDTLADAPGSLFQALAAGARSLPVLLPLLVIENWGHFLLPLVPATQAQFLRPLIEFALFLTNLALVALFSITDIVVLEEPGSLLSTLRRAHRLIGGHRLMLVLVYVAMRVVETMPYTVAPFAMTLSGGTWTRDSWTLALLGIAVFRMLFGMPFRAFIVDYYRQLVRLQDGLAPGEAGVVFD